MVKLKHSHSACKAILQRELLGNWSHSSTSSLRKLLELYILMTPLLLFPLCKIPWLFPFSLHSQLIIILCILGSGMCSTKPFLTSLWKVSTCAYNGMHPK